MASNSTAPLLTTRAQQLFPAVVAILFVGALSAVGDVIVSALGSPATGVQFRFQAIGIALAVIPQIATLLMITAGLATLAGHRVAVRLVAICSFVVAIGALIAILPFGLDFLQSRRLVSDAQLKGFTLAGMKTAGFAGWFALLLLWAGMRAMQASVKPDTDVARARGEGLVVGQD